MFDTTRRFAEPAVSWLRGAFQYRRVQIITTALVSGSVVASMIFAYQASSRRRRIRALKLSIDPDKEDHDIIADLVSKYRDHVLTDESASESLKNKSSHPHEASTEVHTDAALAKRARKGDYSEELILEQLARNRVFLTPDGLSKVRSAFVIIVGLGGVGSHATAALARSGVSKLRLVDFDQVTLSSLNRHAVATLADVGTPKVDCMRLRLEQVTPWVRFDCRNQLFAADAASHQLEPWESDGQAPDYIVDAIDNIDSKIELLRYCKQNGLKVVSSMGAGCKSDPTRVFIGDISASMEDPLSRSVRRRLKAVGVSSGIPVVFSSEKAAPGKAELLPLPEDEFQKGKVAELGVLPDFRVRILPVLGTMPAVFGLCIANHIMVELAEYPHEYILAKGREKMYDAILAQLQGSEERLARAAGENAVGLRLPVTQDDVGYLVEEVYRGRSAVSGLPTRLALVRWRKPEGRAVWVDKKCDGQKCSRLTLKELVCMTKEEASRHEKEILRDATAHEDLYEPQVLDLVSRRMREEEMFEGLR